MNIEISKKMIIKIIGIMVEYFDADNVTMSTDDTSTGVSVTMFSNESPYRSVGLNESDGIITISTDYSIPDDHTKVRLWELVFTGRTVSKFKPLTMDIAFPDQLIHDIIAVFNEV